MRTWPAPAHDAASRSAPRRRRIRAGLEQLRGEGVLELEHGAYRASEIAPYGSYHIPRSPEQGDLQTKPELDAVIADYLSQAAKLGEPPMARCPLESYLEAIA